MIFDAKPHAACGPDGIPHVMLQALWPVIKEVACDIYCACLCLLAALRTPFSTSTYWINDTSVLVHSRVRTSSRVESSASQKRTTWRWTLLNPTFSSSYAQAHADALLRHLTVSGHTVLLGVTLDLTLSFHQHVSAGP